jgi:hypothetical protein
MNSFLHFCLFFFIYILNCVQSTKTLNFFLGNHQKSLNMEFLRNLFLVGNTSEGEVDMKFRLKVLRNLRESEQEIGMTKQRLRNEIARVSNYVNLFKLSSIHYVFHFFSFLVTISILFSSVFFYLN